MIIISQKSPGVIDVQTVIDPKRRRMTGLLPAGGEGGVLVSQMPRIGDMVPPPAEQPAVGSGIYPISTGEPPPPAPEHPITAEEPAA